MKTFSIIQIIAFILLLTKGVDAQTNVDWLSHLPDSISIGDINIPGAHDAAAINIHKMTHYACQSISITGQLDSGIRMLDIRIKVKKHGANYSFATCHGNIFGGALEFNEYQSFSSLLNECKDFLVKHKSEFIIMTLKMDDWNRKDKTHVYAALDSLLFSKTNNYPVYNISDADLPTINKVRGKIYLLSRIDSTNEFGVPLTIPDKKCGVLNPINKLRNYSIYVQDRYKDLGTPAEKLKFELVKETIEKKKKGDGIVVLNFASAIKGFMNLGKVYLQDSLLTYFGSKTAAIRPAYFGWTMLNYSFWKYKTDNYNNLDIVKLIISSNFQYTNYFEKFRVISGRCN
ncbi:MAG TPA: phosphatidylinositol-specific phospholipase C domain-containing protein [Bacteroidia bacterium]|nr:phosphatidylinositol-specific phospholipase C domain-containing protein [Bacteroidia bacterium]